MILASVSRIGPVKQIEYLARFQARNPPEYTNSMLRRAEIFP
jgi:hypothetical protein